jgi:hypothetical protein
MTKREKPWERGWFLDISDGVRKNFLSLNVADIGAKAF